MDSYLVCYDIADPKRLRKVASCCEDFGLRAQYSVFLCRLTPTGFAKLKSRLYALLDLDKDQVIFIPLCTRCLHGMQTLGRPTDPPEARDVVIVV